MYHRYTLTTSYTKISSSTTYEYDYSNQTAGSVRFNRVKNSLEYKHEFYSQWEPVPQHVTETVLSPMAEDIIAWAEKKMWEERDLQKTIEQHPEFAELYEEIKSKTAMLNAAITLAT